MRKAYAALGWARSRHYAPARTEPVIDAVLAQTVRTIHTNSRRTYGARRMARSLQQHGFKVGRGRARTLMRRLDIQLRKKEFAYAKRNTKPAPAENTVNQQFDPGRKNEIWAGDITFIRTNEGFLYLAIVVDLFSRRVVGWATSASPDARLAIKASRLAIAMRNPEAGLIVHTDQGASYTADLYTQHLAEHGFVQSMSRKGNCWDNAVVERVFRSLKHEWFGERAFRTKAEAADEAIDFIGRYYNFERLHSTLNYLPPAEFERMAA